MVNLPPDQLVEFTGWLVNNETYASTKAKLKERFGVVISEHGISEFWRKYCAPELDQREAFIRRTIRLQVQQRLAIQPAEAPQASTKDALP